MMSDYPTSMSIPRVDGLSTDNPGMGRHIFKNIWMKFTNIGLVFLYLTYLFFINDGVTCLIIFTLLLV